MKVLFMVLAWLLPPFAFFRQWGSLGAAISTAAWLTAGACAIYLWAGPGLIGLFVLSIYAGALELVRRPK